VGEVGEEKKQLLRTTKEALYKGIENAVAGRHIGDIGAAVQDHCETQGYGIVRELTGHGIGHEMHEDPQVPNYGRRGNGVMLKASMCIAIEPMVTMGKREIYLDSNDRWTIRTRDGKPAAHFEHTVAVRKGKAEILSSFEEIETIEGKLY
jgi:methionyl aminopeptidase